MAHFPKPFQKEFKYFWGYRNFVLSDVLSELPLLEETRVANVVDSKVIIPQLRLAKDRFDLKAKPYIARNLRREKDLKASSTGCPWMHSQFVKGTGCFAYTQVVSEDIRKQIAYGTPKFKKVYNLRSECERIFSRLLDLCMQNPSVRRLRAVSNHCTIAHITVLLVALTAAKTGNKDKIRFVKSFLPNI